MATKKDLVRYKEVRRADLLDDQKTALQILASVSTSQTQEDLQQYVLSQIKRIIWGNDPGRWNDDFVSEGVLSLNELTRAHSFYADCLATDAVGMAAYVTGPAVLGIPQVTKVDITSPGNYPAVGIIAQKLSATRCVVQVVGELSLSPTILLPEKTYFVGLDSRPTPTPPTAPVGGRASIQAVGVAIDTDRLFLTVTPTRFIRAG